MHRKVVNSLPGTLEANTIYYVLVSGRVRVYVTNNTGTVVAYEVLDGSSTSFTVTGIAPTDPRGRVTLSGSDLNDFPQGLIYASGSNANLPSGMLSGFVYTAYVINADFAHQQAFDNFSQKQWTRWKRSGTWGAWATVYSSAQPQPDRPITSATNSVGNTVVIAGEYLTTYDGRLLHQAIQANWSTYNTADQALPPGWTYIPQHSSLPTATGAYYVLTHQLSANVQNVGFQLAIGRSATLNASDREYIWIRTTEGGAGAYGSWIKAKVGFADNAGLLNGQAASAFAPASHTHALSQLTQSGASTGQVIQWNGSAWVPATVASGGITNPLTADLLTDGFVIARTNSVGSPYIFLDTASNNQEAPVHNFRNSAGVTARISFGTNLIFHAFVNGPVTLNYLAHDRANQTTTIFSKSTRNLSLGEYGLRLPNETSGNPIVNTDAGAIWYDSDSQTFKGRRVQSQPGEKILTSNDLSRYPEGNTALTSYSFYTNFLSATPWDSFWQYSGTGTGAGANMELDAAGDNLISLTTGTTATGRAAAVSGTNSNQAAFVMIAGRTHFYKARARLLDGVSDGTNTFEALVGFFNSLTGNPNGGAFFRYTTTGTLQTVTRVGSTETANNVAAYDPLVEHTFEIIMNGTTNVQFYLDGTLIATHTTNLNTVNRMWSGANIRKTLGTTARRLGCWFMAQKGNW